MKKVLVLVFTGIIMTLLSQQPARVAAQQQRYLYIAPAIEEVTMKPGETKELFIVLSNRHDTPNIAYLSTEDFIDDPDRPGKAKFVDKNDQNGLSQYIKLRSTEISVPANSKIHMTYTIEFPEDVEPVSRYGAIVFSSSKETDDNVAVGAEATTLVFVDIEGEADRDVSIGDIRPRRFIFWDYPVDISTIVKNEGNVRAKPFGVMEIHNTLFKKEKLAKQTVNPDINFVLPGSTRDFVNTYQKDDFHWKIFGFKIPVIGRFRATDTLTVFNGQSLQRNAIFYFIPLRFILKILTILVVIYLLIKAYNKYIISKAQKKR